MRERMWVPEGIPHQLDLRYPPMRRIVIWTLVVASPAMLRSVPLLAAEEVPPPVEEWQIKGILAALKDGYKDRRRTPPGLRSRSHGSRLKRWLVHTNDSSV